jgi:L-ribulokinase
MAKEQYVIGLDYGTDSVRALVVNVANGKSLGTAVHYYARWKKGKYCVPDQNQFRQHPLDYIEGLESAIKGALKDSPAGTADKVIGLAVDTTGSTPVAVDESGTPLALTKGFEENPNAMFVLWKDHTGIKEADQINALARSWGGEDFTKYEGGIYSSEWFWAKITHVVREDKAVAAKAYSWVEHCDWIPGLLTGNTAPKTMMRSRCAAGHKAMWHPAWKGLPSEEFLVKLEPKLEGLRARLFSKTQTSENSAGTLTAEWAKKLGLSTKVHVSVGAFDAHMGAVGGEITPNVLLRIMGTSTCDILVVPEKAIKGKAVRGICGQVDGSVYSGVIGLEAGQSAFGDVYAWFKNVLSFPLEHAGLTEAQKEKVADGIIPALEKAALKVPISESGVVALDWMNGRRTPDANQSLKGVIANINLGSDAPRIYRALVEATAFGSKKIVDRFRDEGVEIKAVLALGGVAKKSPFVMQTLSDVLNMPVKVVKSEQACALGAAMFAAVSAGAHKDIPTAQKAMGSGFDAEYKPNAARAKQYQGVYARYSKLGSIIETQFTRKA